MAYKPYDFYKPYVQAVLSRRYSTCFLYGGIAMGKTMVQSWLLGVFAGAVYHKNLLKYTMPPCKDGVRRTKTYVVRAKIGDIGEATKPVLQELFPSIADQFRGLSNRQNPQCFIKGDLPDGTGFEWEIIGRPLADDKQLESFSGLQMTNAFFDEVAWLDETRFSAAAERVGRFPTKKRYPELWNVDEEGRPVALFHDIVLAATNPHGEDNWVFQREKRGNAKEFFFQTPPVIERLRFGTPVRGADGKPVYTPAGKEVLKNVLESHIERPLASREEEIERKVFGRFAKYEEGIRVFEAFDPMTHTIDSTDAMLSERDDLYVGIDAGGNTYSPAAIFAQRRDDQFVVFYEYAPFEYQRRATTTHAFAREVVRYLTENFEHRRVKCFIDPASTTSSVNDINNRSTMRIMQEEGLESDSITLRECPISNNDQVSLRAGLEVLLREKSEIYPMQRIVMNRTKCPVLCRALKSTYVFKKKSATSMTGDFAEKPHKQPPDADCVDALLYLLAGAGMRGEQVDRRAVHLQGIARARGLGARKEQNTDPLFVSRARRQGGNPFFY